MSLTARGVTIDQIAGGNPSGRAFLAANGIVANPPSPPPAIVSTVRSIDNIIRTMTASPPTTVSTVPIAKTPIITTATPTPTPAPIPVAVVPIAKTPIVTVAPAAAPIVKPQITAPIPSAPVAVIPPPSPITAEPSTIPQMSLLMGGTPSSPTFSGPSGLGAPNQAGWGGIAAGAAGAIAGAVVDWATGKIRGGGGAGTGTLAPPAIPAGGGMQTMGVGSQIGRIGGAVGSAVGRAVSSPTGRKVRGVVGGVLGWWLIDKATGALLGPTTPPRRSMNVLNPRALRRADRRVDGFVKVARKMLSSTGFQVTRRQGKCAPKRKRCK